jgi:hypothetical protein
LSLNTTSSGLRVRAFLHTAPTHHEAAMRDGQLVIRVATDRRGQPAKSAHERP